MCPEIAAPDLAISRTFLNQIKVDKDGLECWAWRETRFTIALDDDASWLQHMNLIFANCLERYLAIPDSLTAIRQLALEL
jgi:hypothetical protein